MLEGTGNAIGKKMGVVITETKRTLRQPDAPSSGLCVRLMPGRVGSGIDFDSCSNWCPVVQPGSSS